VGLLDHITSHPDWPIDGIVFRDLNPIYRDPGLMREAAAIVAATARDLSPDGDGAFSIVVAPEARGFILGPMLAIELGAGFLPVRKPEKLPPPVRSHSYEVEYGPDSLEIQAHPLAGAGPVLIYDDILATGGTATATARLVEALDGVPAGFAFLLELDGLGGRDALAQATGLPVGAALTD
jgi:adenine phosphoribosyltransferase